MNSGLPKSNILSVNKLSAVFNNTAASYKYYWFISILQLLSERNNNKILIKDILIKMICNAWYPINYFKLNFGFRDKLINNIQLIQDLLGISLDIPLEELFQRLTTTENNDAISLILHFSTLVPFRFLSPWLGSTRDRNMIIRRAKLFENNCLYRFNTDISYIEINPDWYDYLIKNHKILLDFAYWNLLKYLQTRNPNVPNIADKLIKPIERGSLSRQRKFWDMVIPKTKDFKCIYTGKPLSVGNYDIDHFIPWSFVSHDQMWNLLPSDSSINSSKSNKLPSLKKYFDDFVDLQFHAIKIVYEKEPRNKLLEDYFILNLDLNHFPYDDFKKKYWNILSPLIQIASNSGFEFWES